MASKSDFTGDEWTALQRGITGSAMLVSLADRDLSDTFGEVGAMSKYLAGQQVAGSTELVRELAKTHGTGFGLGTSPDRLLAETMDALGVAQGCLSAKAPDEVGPYGDLVLGVVQAVAEAKGGVAESEAATIERIRAALGRA